MDVHLVKRLREICGLEDLKADSKALSTLVGIAQGDLRGCLNTLQVCGFSKIFRTRSLINSAVFSLLNPVERS
jgi:chromosome transmission fidelity protein 18